VRSQTQQLLKPGYGQKYHALAGAANTFGLETPAFLLSLEFLLLFVQAKSKEINYKRESIFYMALNFYAWLAFLTVCMRSLR
jgi:hypothetical protein